VGYKKVTQKFFGNNYGRIVLWQTPNVPLIVWFGCNVANWLIASRGLSLVLHEIGTVALVIWAVLELGRGESYFRRTLGLVVLIWAVGGLLW
jgi:hypothetical protein